MSAQSIAGLQVTGMDHIVLCTRDVYRSISFYERILGLRPERLTEFRAGSVPFPSVRIDEGTIIDLLPVSSGHLGAAPAQNQDHFCLVIKSTDLEKLKESLEKADVNVVTGPATRWGARGNATSIYIKDPDDNIIELRHYGT